MIKRSFSIPTQAREHMRDGEGTVYLNPFATPEEMNNKGRLFSKVTLKSGCSIGYHVHETDCELFYILKGTAVYNDNGTPVIVSPGDVCICPTGSGHSIANNDGEDVELIAVIFYA